MYFKRYIDFINEDLQKKKKRREDQLIQDKARGKSEKKIKRSEKRLKKTEDKIEDKEADSIGDTGKVVQNPQQEETSQEETPKEETTETTGKIPSNNELIEMLNNWNKKYSQAFKFQHDKPKQADIKTDEYEGQFQILINVAAESYANEISKSIDILVKLFKTGHYDEKSVDVIGHTSAPGSNEYNKQLSNRRSLIVINAIKDKYMQINKEEIKVKLNMMGKGEEDLIITNDEESGKPEEIKVSSKYDKKNIIANLKGDGGDKSRQRINRRVEIQLAGIEPKYEIEDITQPTKETVKGQEREKPSPPNPAKITFNYNSYILTENSKALLKAFGSEVMSWNEESEDDKISELFMSAHTQIPKNELDNSMKDHFILSSNRSYMVKLFFEKLGLTDTSFKLLPVAFTVPNDNGDDKRVEIHFSENEKVKKSKMEYEELSQKFNFVKSDGGFYSPNQDKVILNSVMRKSIIKNIKNGRKNKLIPPELWIEKYAEKEKDIDKFKNKVRKASNKNDEDIENDFVFNKK